MDEADEEDSPEWATCVQSEGNRVTQLYVFLGAMQFPYQFFVYNNN